VARTARIPAQAGAKLDWRAQTRACVLDGRPPFGEQPQHDRELERESAAVHVGVRISVGTRWRSWDVGRVKAGDPKATP
jgi:hypothetical protein